MRFALAFTVLAVLAAAQSPEGQLAGVWRGQSICVAADRGACTDETVVYYISAIAGKAGIVSIRADKIVNGQAVTMGTSEWKHDAERHTLTWETAPRTWLLKIQGDTMEGTLTLTDKTVVRRVTLKRTGDLR
jgi:hypothetical protein